MIKLGTISLKYLPKGDPDRLTYDKLNLEANTDRHTGCYNKTYFNNRIDLEVKKSKVTGEPLSLIIFDLDHFKKLNDNFGHDAGDFVLKEMATLIRNKGVRDLDVFARYGGEEFVILLPKTNLKQAYDIAERLRKQLEEHEFMYDDQRLPVTASIGVADYRQGVTSGTELFKKELIKRFINPSKEEETRYSSTELESDPDNTIFTQKFKYKTTSEHLIDQIKAGEVVERPASLLKELIENSIDAGSTKIDIHIIDNGMELIFVKDNGKGMSFDDLPLAFHRHATSKIQKFEDLYQLHSFGFRGEALASIASTARVTCISSPNDGRKSGRIVIHGGEQKSLTESEESQHGTSFYIKDLFFNTPARLKFIRSANSERVALKRIINSFILANPSVTFSVKWDNKEKSFFPSVSKENINSRIKKYFLVTKI